MASPVFCLDGWAVDAAARAEVSANVRVPEPEAEFQPGLSAWNGDRTSVPETIENGSRNEPEPIGFERLV
jgi:hypothetical protein